MTGIETRVQIGDLELVSSGAVTFGEQSTVSVTLGSGPTDTLTVHFSVTQVPNAFGGALTLPPPSEVRWKTINATTLGLELRLVPNAGETALGPTRIGTVAGREVHFSFSVVAIGNLWRLIYSVFARAAQGG